MPQEMRQNKQKAEYAGKLLTKKRGRPPSNGKTLTAAERQRAYRARAKQAEKALGMQQPFKRATPVELRATLSVEDAHTLKEQAKMHGIKIGELLALFARALRERNPLK